jgi:hypothetical protein
MVKMLENVINPSNDSNTEFTSAEQIFKKYGTLDQHLEVSNPKFEHILTKY